MLRDSQRSKLYSAERKHSLYKKFYIDDVADLQKYVDSITSSKWFIDKFNYNSIKVKDGRGRRSACATKYYIKLPVWSRYKLCILHEVAHTITPYNYAGHGREFANNFLVLVRHFMGKEPYFELKSLFKQHRVKYCRVKNTSSNRVGNPNIYQHLLAWREKQTK